MTNDEPVKTNARISTLVEKLRGKLKNFIVLDRQGQLIGKVEELLLDTQGQLNLIVSQMATSGSRSFLVMSKLIQKIDPPNKSVLVNMNLAEFNELPEYVNTEPNLNSEILDSPVVPAQESLEDISLNDSILSTPDFQLQNIQEEVNDLNALEPSVPPQVLEEEIIRLLEERLIVDRSKRKVGEVIVRKEIEIRMIQVPVRREKLIVEQVSPEQKKLAEIDLGEQEVADIELPEIASTDTEPTVRGVFNSPKVASLLLNAIALERRHGCKKVRVEIIVEDAERQKTYQEWVNRCSDSQPHKSES